MYIYQTNNNSIKMSQLGTLRYTICVTLIAAFISPGFCCTEDEFQCKTGECISVDLLCDGQPDCPDESDETAQSCIQLSCPPYTYRCTYGACVSGSAECNGIKECADGSDEAIAKCQSDKPTSSKCSDGSDEIHCSAQRRRRNVPTNTSTSGCIAPAIGYANLVLEEDATQVITAGDTVPDGTSIKYQCYRGYRRIGIQFNICSQSAWLSTPHPECLKFCKPIDGETYKAECEFEGDSRPCGAHIVPGTIARISCRIQYRKSGQPLPNVLRCESDGTWDYAPYRCEPMCGEQVSRIQPLALNSSPTHKTEVPWHVVIYKVDGLDRSYVYNCGGNIISEKLVISAAHCFWDSTKSKLFNNSLFLVGAGKYYRDITANEPYAQFQDVSEIIIPLQFTGPFHQSDIAVLVLANFLRFSAIIAPVCIEWKDEQDQVISSNIYGKVAGFGTGDIATSGLLSGDLPSISYDDCKTELIDFSSILTNDTFCARSTLKIIVCRGDSGVGFAERRNVGGRKVHFLQGIATAALPIDNTCSTIRYITFTNIQFYRSMIEEQLIIHRIK